MVFEDGGPGYCRGGTDKDCAKTGTRDRGGGIGGAKIHITQLLGLLAVEGILFLIKRIFSLCCDFIVGRAIFVRLNPEPVFEIAVIVRHGSTGFL